MCAFVRGRVGTITREFNLDSYMNLGKQVELVTDASPWGLGGYVTVDRQVKEFYQSELDENDFANFGHAKGDCRGQQAWEALAMLVALRLWADTWLTGRVRLRVRGDSVAMLTVVMHMKAVSDSSAMLVAREVALDVAEAAYAPDVGSHLPGDANATADVLSRRWDPNAGEWRLPPVLAGAIEAVAPQRSQAYYRILASPV